MAQDNYIFDLVENVTRTPVTYETRYGIEIAADLYKPADFDESKSYPALIVGAPYGGVKEQGPGVYANQLAQKGFIVLTFDPSFNGNSGGYPRHLSSPDVFVEDFMAAVDFLGSRDFVERENIGAIGICGSGGFALSAAKVDPRIKAVATTSMYDISRMQKLGMNDSMSDEERQKSLKQIAEQRYADFEAASPALTGRGAPLDWDDDAPQAAQEFGSFYSRPRGYHPNSITQFTVTSTPSWMNFALLDDLDWLAGRPILLIAGEIAHSLYFSEDVYEAAAEPKELFVIPKATHVDLYDKTDVIPFDKLVSFFKTAFE